MYFNLLVICALIAYSILNISKFIFLMNISLERSHSVELFYYCEESIVYFLHSNGMYMSYMKQATIAEPPFTKNF